MPGFEYDSREGEDGAEGGEKLVGEGSESSMTF